MNIVELQKTKASIENLVIMVENYLIHSGCNAATSYKDAITLIENKV